MTVDASTIVLALGIFSGALVSGFMGFAFSGAAGAFLLHVLPPAEAVPLMMVCSLLVQSASLVALRQHVQWRAGAPLIVGGLLGIPSAIYVLTHAEPGLIRTGFGLFLALYSAYMLLRPRSRLFGHVNGSLPDGAAGFLGGVVGGLTAMPGAIPTMWCDLRGIPKDQQRGFVQPYIATMQVAALALLVFERGLPQALAGNVIVSLAPLAAGAVLGLALFGKVNDRVFRRAILYTLLLSGVGHFIPAAHAEDATRRVATRLFGELKATGDATGPRAVLGRALFWDARISLDGKTSCASCHSAADWGADRRVFPPDARGMPSSRQSPTVFNSMSQPMLRWLGDRKSGADQAEGSLTGSLGFASKSAAVAKLEALGYRKSFEKVFAQDADPLSTANYARAVAAYEKTLVTPAPFDRYLAGDDAALSSAQKSGLRRFISLGCAGCHDGPNLGGAQLQRFGVTKDYWLETSSGKPDTGRFALTKKEEDRYVFRVPMLRNVARTAPYFHDGSIAGLPQAVRVMASVQLGQALDDVAVADIVAFLDALTGEVPPHYAPAVRPAD